MDQELETSDGTTVPSDSVQSSEQPSISLQDLVVILNVIRLSADRGAVKIDEMATVGAVYQKLFAFLKAAGAISDQATESNQ